MGRKREADRAEEGDGGRDRRPRLNALGVNNNEYEFDVSEVFSPPCVCDLARARGMKGGYSLHVSEIDPVSGRKWDLTNRRDLQSFWKLRRSRRSRLIVASPPCPETRASGRRTHERAEKDVHAANADRRL